MGGCQRRDQQRFGGAQLMQMHDISGGNQIRTTQAHRRRQVQPAAQPHREIAPANHPHTLNHLIPAALKTLIDSERVGRQHRHVMVARRQRPRCSLDSANNPAKCIGGRIVRRDMQDLHETGGR